MNRRFTTMVVPAEKRGWEVWESTKGVVEKTRNVEGGLGESGLSSDVCIFLPVNIVATLPFVVQSEDVELCKGAAQLALEKSGLIEEADEEAWDSVVIEKGGGVSLVAGHALLEDVFEGVDDLKDVEVDYSPRIFDVGSGDVIVCWMEQGVWSLACYKNNKPFYTEPLGLDLDRSLLSAVRQLDGQLMVADIDFNPERLMFLSEVGAVREGEWSQALGVPVVSESRPVPKFLGDSLNIRTVGMIDWSQKRKAGSKNKLWFGMIAAIYLIAGGLIFWNFRKLDEEIEKTRIAVEQTAAVSQTSSDHILKWEELDDLVKDKWPLEVYMRFYLLIPPRSAMRFEEVEVQENDTLVLRGYAPKLDSINDYVQKLKSDPNFVDLEWVTPPSVENPKTKLWEFAFEAKIGGEI